MATALDALELRGDLAAAGLTVTETEERLGCARLALSRLLNGQGGHLAGHGDRTGAPRVKQRGLLDVAAGGLRPGPAASSAGGLNA